MGNYQRCHGQLRWISHLGECELALEQSDTWGATNHSGNGAPGEQPTTVGMEHLGSNQPQWEWSTWGATNHSGNGAPKIRTENCSSMVSIEPLQLPIKLAGLMCRTAIAIIPHECHIQVRDHQHKIFSHLLITPSCTLHELYK